MSSTLRALLFPATLCMLVACDAATGPGLELAAARARWEQRGPASYTITVARWCECLEEWVGPVIVTVVDDAVESRHYTRTGAVVPSEYAHLFPAVEGLFERVEAARREGVARLSVRYDRTFGYPVRIAMDPDGVTGNDDEVTYEATDLEAR